MRFIIAALIVASAFGQIKITPSGGAAGAGGASTVTMSGTSGTLPSGAPAVFYCTATCTVTVPAPAAGAQYVILNATNVAGIITLAALGGSRQYQNTLRTAYGTAGTGTLVSGGATGDMIVIYYRDATHYDTISYTNSWTAN